jgi:carboxypeptidase family protein
MQRLEATTGCVILHWTRSVHGVVTDNLHRPFLISVISIIVVMCMSEFAHTAGGAGTSKGRGVLTGKVIKGPVTPAQETRTPSSMPAPGVQLLILTLEGQEVYTVVTDAQGTYSIALPVGPYRIEIAPLSGIEFTKDLPTAVTVIEGQETYLDITIDTGIR